MTMFWKANFVGFKSKFRLFKNKISASSNMKIKLIKNLRRTGQVWGKGVSTLTRLRYQVRPSRVVFAWRLLMFLGSMKRKMHGTELSVIPEKTSVTEINTVDKKGQVSSIHQRVPWPTWIHSEIRDDEFHESSSRCGGMACCKYPLPQAPGLCPKWFSGMVHKSKEQGCSWEYEEA